MNICDEKKCCGCFECLSVCPCDAIVFKTTEKGFFVPIIDENNCIGCNECKRICQGNNKNIIGNKPEIVLAAYNTDENIRVNSSSGGIFSLLAEDIIKEGGVVFGAAFDKELKLKHIMCDSLSDLKLLRRSKYLQSDTSHIYEKVKEITKKKKVLFSGTPCQCAALRNYIGDSDNLYIIDIVCHGVVSQEAFDRHINEKSYGNKKKITNVYFRYKTTSWNFSNMRYDYEDDTTEIVEFTNDPYAKLFTRNYLLRESCYECKYTSTYRVGDITLSDFWGFAPSNKKFRNFDKGISCFMINTEKGADLYKKIENKLVSEKRTLQEAIQANSCLKEPSKKKGDYDNFIMDFKTHSIAELGKKYGQLQEYGNIIKLMMAVRKNWYLIPNPIKNLMLAVWRSK